jgi:hypothetical protein
VALRPLGYRYKGWGALWSGRLETEREW